jgi:hypothetical protein
MMIDDIEEEEEKPNIIIIWLQQCKLDNCFFFGLVLDVSQKVVPSIAEQPHRRLSIA